MNRLSVRERAIILHALCEGMSMRSCERVFNRPFKTIRKIVKDVGDWAIHFHRNAPQVACEHLQADEIWSFVGENDRKTGRKKTGVRDRGVCWTYLAVDRPTKLIVAYHIGTRTAVDAAAFMRKLEGRLLKDERGDYVVTPTLAVDGLKAYEDAIELAFGGRVHAGIFQKQYSKLDENGEPLPSSKYQGAIRIRLQGNPDEYEINTWMIERENGFVRQANRRFTRKSNAFSKAMEFHERQVAITMFYRNYCWEPYPSKPRDGSRTWPKRNTAAMNCSLSDHVWTADDMIVAADEFIASRPKDSDGPVAEPAKLKSATNPYWVNHKPFHRAAKIHHADCSSCNDGQGKGRGPSKHSVWIGFENLEDATAHAAKLEPDLHSICRLCLGTYNTLSTYGPRR